MAALCKFLFTTSEHLGKRMPEGSTPVLRCSREPRAGEVITWEGLPYVLAPHSPARTMETVNGVPYPVSSFMVVPFQHPVEGDGFEIHGEA